MLSPTHSPRVCSFSPQADKEKFNGLDASRQTIDALLTEEIASGTPSARIVLGGFSQGAAVSLFTSVLHMLPLLPQGRCPLMLTRLVSALCDSPAHSSPLPLFAVASNSLIASAAF